MFIQKKKKKKKKLPKVNDEGHVINLDELKSIGTHWDSFIC